MLIYALGRLLSMHKLFKYVMSIIDAFSCADDEKNCWNLHSRRGICLKTYYFRFIALICSFLALQIPFSIQISIDFIWFFNYKLHFLFPQYFPPIFAVKNILLTIQNISTVVNSVFITWTSDLRTRIWFPSVLCYIHE